jgi:hypothetical protein
LGISHKICRASNQINAFWDKSDNKETFVIATHGFIKKVDKVPANEISRAVRLREKYFNSNSKK